MLSFTAHRLHFIAEVRTPMELNEHQGSAIRGALFHALRNRFCANREAKECALCPLVAACPVAFLVSTLRPESRRGRDIPRPFTLQPPLPGSGHPVRRGDRLAFRYEPGERLEFGLTLYARALQLFPYVVLAVSEFERGGIGRRTEQADGCWRRGTLTIREIWAENPLTGERQPVLRAGDRMVQVPDVPITHAQVVAVPVPPPGAVVTLHFRTPVRLVEEGALVKPHRFTFRPFFQRLMERLEALSGHYADTPRVFDDPKGLIAAAGQVEVVENRLRWEEVWSYSTRRRDESPISGLLGSVSLRAGDWTPFWPWLLWGQFTHVGKDAVKGNGWYGVGSGEWGMKPEQLTIGEIGIHYI
ncbi:MAG: CRISPR system precrRNA processing endoribonuclease RAMP protein Cas6 [Anaerolineae bacterium]|nr:CRISPR system precrRNA processing endoribonuclease RAMP protein Cas6 [Anaerolineae bacterium]